MFLISVIRKAILISSVGIILSGCNAFSDLSSVDVAISPEDLASIRANDSRCLNGPSLDGLDIACRNEYISMRMFLIDQEFAKYKIALSRGDAYGNLAAELTQIGLGAAGGLAPASQTTKVLLAASAAVGLANTAVNKDLLLTQTMQIIEQEMGTLRLSVKQTIIGRMLCKADYYPIGFILSDLQEYADAGTVTGALNAIAKSTAGAQATTNGTTGTATPTTTSTSPSTKPTAACPLQPPVQTANKTPAKPVAAPLPRG